jgi:hypothetical protein
MEVDIEIGKWYLVMLPDYPRSIRVKVVKIKKLPKMEVIWAKFYLPGNLFRTTQIVNKYDIIGKCKRPKLFSNYR